MKIRKWICEKFDCQRYYRDCTEEVAKAVKESQEDCNRIIIEREGKLREEIAEWTGEYRKCCEDRTYWQQKFDDCMTDKPYPQPGPDLPKSKAIHSLEVKDGKFWVNGKATKLYGVSKREMIAVGSGDKLQSEVNYKYADIKKAILDSNINYIRVLAGKNLEFFRKEVKDYLEHGVVVEVELWDAGNPNREYQAYWAKTFEAVKDLPVFFDAHNEFLTHDWVFGVVEIVDYVTSNGGIISAGAWSEERGEQLSQEFKKKCNAYQVVSHHREWVRESLKESMEVGKPIIMNEIHTRDIELVQAKNLFKSAFDWGCQGANVYPLMNWGSGKGSNFQKILDFVGEFRTAQEGK